MIRNNARLNAFQATSKKNPEPWRYPDFSKLTQLNFYQVHLEELGMNLKFINSNYLTINCDYEILCKIIG